MTNYKKISLLNRFHEVASLSAFEMATGATVDKKWVLNKPDGSNWVMWNFKMRHLLLAKGRWGIIDGIKVLANDASPQLQAEFEKLQRALSTILLEIYTSQLYHMTSCEKPREAWGVLCNYFERDTLANKLFLKKQYFQAEMNDGTLIEGHLKRMKELTDKRNNGDCAGIKSRGYIN